MSVYYYRKNGKEFGPIHKQQLQQLALNGEISPNDAIRSSTSTKYFYAKSLDFLEFKGKASSFTKLLQNTPKKQNEKSPQTPSIPSTAEENEIAIPRKIFPFFLPENGKLAPLSGKSIQFARLGEASVGFKFLDRSSKFANCLLFNGILFTFLSVISLLGFLILCLNSKFDPDSLFTGILGILFLFKGVSDIEESSIYRSRKVKLILAPDILTFEDEDERYQFKREDIQDVFLEEIQIEQEAVPFVILQMKPTITILNLSTVAKEPSSYLKFGHGLAPEERLWLAQFFKLYIKTGCFPALP